MQQPPGWGPPSGHPQHGYPPPQGYQQGPYGPPPGWGPPPPQPKPRWYHGAAIVLPSLFCCFPAGVALLWTSPVFSKNGKVGLTLAGAALAIFGVISAVNAPPRDTTSTKPVATSTSTSATPQAAEASPQPAREPAVEVTAKALAAAYEANEVRADAQYKGKTVMVTGIVNDIGKGVLGGMYIVVGTGAQIEIPAVQASFSKEFEGSVAALSKGERTTVLCKCRGLALHVQLGDCEFMR
ncbi:OB-fold protein [Sorangium sp. So ce1024]|uniref:OB-fold protein n=1 Tax=Sorangium sp. So ce1024 TaxID=3133327 RepID=UPI003F0B775F